MRPHDRKTAPGRQQPDTLSMTVARSISLAIVAVLVSATATVAADPKAYVCTFPTGASNAFSNGAFKPEAAGNVALEITDIAADQQTATLKSGGRIGGLRVVRAVNALHFLEAGGEGYLNITTVYERDGEGAAAPAVHSRHFGVLGQPVVSQYLGSCVAK
jgi:hypothetical protein